MNKDSRRRGVDDASIDQDERVLEYQWDERVPPSIAVVEAVAAATDRDATALPSLHRAIDGDALDSALTTGTDSSAQITFTYADTVVSVDRSGAIEVSRPQL